MPMSRDEVTRAYRCMRTIREFEECIHIEFGKGSIPGFVHLSAGGEASAAGVCLNLGEKDYITTTHRGHGHTIAKGCDLESMFKEIFGRQGGLCNGKGGSMHVADLSKGMLGANGIVGAGSALACGAALTAKIQKTGSVAVCFLGDGATSEGTVSESFNLAAIWKLPVIFLVEDNGYGQTTPSSYAVAGTFVKRAEGFGIPGVEVDGYDYFAVSEATQAALKRVRAGEGPMLMHLKLTRYYGHFEGDAQNYRSEGEIARLKKEKDCLDAFARRATQAGLIEESDMSRIDQEVKAEIARLVKLAKATPKPTEAALLTDVYCSY